MNENEMNTEVMDANENYEVMDVADESDGTGKAVAIGAATAVVVTAAIAGAAKGVKWIQGKWHDHKVKKAAAEAAIQAEAIKVAANQEVEEEFVEEETEN